MATYGKTVLTMRNEILRRLGAENSSQWQTDVLSKINDAIVTLSMLHDWDYLRKYDTLTIGTTGVVSLPADLDRVLGIHKSGDNPMLVRKQPQDFMDIQEDTSAEKTTFYCVRGYEQTTDGEAAVPRQEIEVWPHPSSSTEFKLWYVKNIDEYEADSNELNDVLNMPPQIAALVQKLALIESMKQAEKPERTVKSEEAMFNSMLDAAKARETMGGAKYNSIDFAKPILSHYQTRFNT